MSIYLHSRMITVRLPHVNLEEANTKATALENASAYVRFTTYDVRLENSRALRGKTADGGKCVWTARMCCPRVKTGDGCKSVWPKAIAFG